MIDSAQCHIVTIFAYELLHFISPIQQRSPCRDAAARAKTSFIPVLKITLFPIQAYHHNTSPLTKSFLDARLMSSHGGRLYPEERKAPKGSVFGGNAQNPYHREVA